MKAKTAVALLLQTTVTQALDLAYDEAYYAPRPKLYLAQDIYLTFEVVQGSEEFFLEVHMPKDHWLALSFGGSHMNTDMIVFDTHSGYDAAVPDMYSDEFGEPKLDTTLLDAGDIEVIEIVPDTSAPLIKFSIRRDFDTGDGEKDFVLGFDQVIRMGFAIRNEVAEERNEETGKIETFGMHDRHGYFDMILGSDERTSYWGMYAGA